MKQHSQLDAALTSKLDKRRRNSTLRKLTTNSTQSVDFSSNDFLSLASSPELRSAFLRELENRPHFTLGSGGSRLLDGNSPYAEDLERDIAAFHRAPAGLLCNAGFDANVGIFSCLPQPGDIIIYDEYIHASVHDGMKVSRAETRLPFAHNDVSALRKVLKSCVEWDEKAMNGRKSIFVAVEAIYSMDGDIAPLREITEVVEELLPSGNGHIIVDEAHATGVMGPKGRGLVCELGLESRVSVRLHTFGKSLACNGAIILSSPLIRSYLLNYARTLIYTTFMSFPTLAAIRAAYSLLETATTVPRSATLADHGSLLHAELLALRAALPADPPGQPRLLLVPHACPRSPIFSIETSEPRALADYCQRHGYLVRPIMPPTIPAGHERIRVCLHAANTEAEIKGLVAKIGEWYVEHHAQQNVASRSSKL